MLNADNLPPSCAVVTKSDSPNFLEPSGLDRACNGTKKNSHSFNWRTESQTNMQQCKSDPSSIAKIIRILPKPSTVLGSCDRESWAKCEERVNQQDATIRCLLSTTVSTCFGHHYAHLQEDKDRVLLHMVYCAGSAGCSNSNLHTARSLQRSAPQPLPTTSSRTSAAHHMQ